MGEGLRQAQPERWVVLNDERAYAMDHTDTCTRTYAMNDSHDIIFKVNGISIFTTVRPELVEGLSPNGGLA